jgi:3-hydroxyisobutyrate dehydrogenase
MGESSMTSNPPAASGAADTIAVLGTGIMGSAMARNLVAAGLRTKVWDRSAEVTAPLAAAGALAAASPQDAIADASVVITMLPTADAVNSVIRGQGLNAFSRGAVWAQMGTIGITATAGLEGTVSQLRPDVMYVDAPVSGSKGPAEAGQLLILASGPPEAEEIVQPVFSAIGRKTVWLGPTGQGSRMKLVVNTYLSFLIEGVAEALELGGRLGIDPAELDAVIEGGPLDAPLADAKLHKIERGDFTPEFPLEWALKDVDLALASADGARLPMLEALSRQWRAAVEAGYGRDDISAARLALSGPARKGDLAMASAANGDPHETIEHRQPSVHHWRASRLRSLGIPETLAEVYADHLDWHQIARLVRRGCPPRLALRIVG